MRDNCQLPIARFLAVQSERCVQCHNDACESWSICSHSIVVRLDFLIKSQARLKQWAEKNRCASASFTVADAISAGEDGARMVRFVVHEAIERERLSEGPINRSATLSVERAALDVDDEESSVLHRLDEPNALARRLAGFMAGPLERLVGPHFVQHSISILLQICSSTVDELDTPETQS